MPRAVLRSSQEAPRGSHVRPLRPFARDGHSANFGVPAKKKHQEPLSGEALIKEVCRRIRFARTLWDAHRNAACRGERTKAIALYETLSPEQREEVPQALRVWLRYRSEKYFGGDRR